MNKTTRYLVRVAAITAITIALQTLLQSTVGGIYIFGTVAVGTVVNLGLFLCTFICGFAGGAAASVVTPVIAALLGRAQWIVTPFIIVSNVAMCAVFAFVLYVLSVRPALGFAIGAAAAAVVKFALLFATAYLIAPLLVFDGGLKAPAVAVLQLNFSYLQLIAAAAGAVLCYFILLALKAAKIDGIRQLYGKEENTPAKT